MRRWGSKIGPHKSKNNIWHNEVQLFSQHKQESKTLIRKIIMENSICSKKSIKKNYA